MRWLPDDQLVVSVVVPMLDELGFIADCLSSFAAQTWPMALLDVIVVDGGSRDGSRQYVDDLAAEVGWLRVIDNPHRKAAAAFNRGVEASRGDVVCLFSSHGVADPSYIERSVAVLRETGAAGVGGRYHHTGLDRASQAIGLAMASPYGMASQHRYASQRVDVDTISHPAYARAALHQVGSFDESLERNSDYEFNFRLAATGERLVFDPTIESIYRPRGSLRALSRQFWSYGRWKARVAERHPRSLRPRHLVPPTALVLGAVIAVFGRGALVRRVGFVCGAAYYVTLVSAFRMASPRRSGASPMVFAAALPTMHVSWGAGFLASLVEDTVKARR